MPASNGNRGVSATERAEVLVARFERFARTAFKRAVARASEELEDIRAEAETVRRPPQAD